MDFTAAEKSFRALENQLVAGELDEESYRQRLLSLRVEDDQGRTWMLQERTGAWFFWNGAAWEPGEPPRPRQVSPPPPPPPPPPMMALTMIEVPEPTLDASLAPELAPEPAPEPTMDAEAAAAPACEAEPAKEHIEQPDAHPAPVLAEEPAQAQATKVVAPEPPAHHPVAPAPPTVSPIAATPGVAPAPPPAVPAPPSPAAPVRALNVFGLIWRLVLAVAVLGGIGYLAWVLDPVPGERGLVVGGVVGLAALVLAWLVWRLTRAYEGVIEKVRIRQEIVIDDKGSTTVRSLAHAYVRTADSKLRRVRAGEGWQRGDRLEKRVGDWGAHQARE
jgi:hypothetical protein